MSNRAIWNVRLRHEWLQNPAKATRVKRRSRLRIGLQEALDRQQPDDAGQESDAEAAKGE